jgi:hypothetical protein
MFGYSIQITVLLPPKLQPRLKLLLMAVAFVVSAQQAATDDVKRAKSKQISNIVV